MANLQQTYSGDLTSALAGAIANKVINAAGMAKEQKEKSAKDNITSQPGSLFASALGHEFGGDLFNRPWEILVLRYHLSKLIHLLLKKHDSGQNFL